MILGWIWCGFVQCMSKNSCKEIDRKIPSSGLVSPDHFAKSRSSLNKLDFLKVDEPKAKMAFDTKGNIVELQKEATLGRVVRYFKSNSHFSLMNQNILFSRF